MLKNSLLAEMGCGVFCLMIEQIGCWPSGCHRRLRHRDQLCDFAEVLDGGGEKELVVSAAGAS
jgi:hypothetical protein